MASGTGRLGWVSMRPGQGESRGAVVKLSGSPSSDRMARCALCGGVREPGRDVIRDSAADGDRPIPITYMASITVRGVQRVIVVDMAGGAGRRSR